MRREDKRSPLEQGRRDTEIRRDTAIRGSMGTPPSGSDDSSKVTPNSDVFNEPSTREQVRGGTPREPHRAARQNGKLPLPD
jgi:hypothetical protein